MTITLEEENNGRRRGWTEQEAKDFITEVERLKELWYFELINTSDAEISTRQALANLRDSVKACQEIEKEIKEHRVENERRKQERLRKIKEENKNLEWPKPDARLLLELSQKKSSDYWKNGCLYCSYYKPQTTHDYEVHIVTRHPGKPAYPGSPDLEKYGQLQNDRKSKVADMAEADSSGNGLLGNA